MRRILVALTILAATAAATPSTIHADATCDAVLADLPILTDTIQTEWVVQNCTARTQIRVTLSEFVGGDWQRADGCLSAGGQCTRVHPTDGEGAECDPFYCAYGSNHHIDSWNQTDSPCGHQWRTKVTVRNPAGDVIATDTSPANTC